MSGYVPKPKYEKEYRDLAVAEKAPLITLDIYNYPRKRRTTETGVLCEQNGRDMIARIERELAKLKEQS